MKILISFIFLLMTFKAYSSGCTATPSFLEPNKKVSTAAVGSFYRYIHSLIFRPLICLNRDFCDDIVFSAYPQDMQDVNYKKLWLLESFSQPFGKIDVIVSQDMTFEEGVKNQVEYINKYLKRKKVNNKNKSLKGPQAESCETTNSSILVIDSSFYEGVNSWGGTIFNRKDANDSFLKNFKITYADDKIKGCGCEDLFDSTKNEFANFSNVLDGYYERTAGKLYFVEESQENNHHEYEIVRKIELEENDKCNPFIDDFLGKKIRLFTIDKINPSITKMPYINACRSRIEFRPKDDHVFLKR